uniref:Peptidase M14 carboxypeptidase A domain-containing protein n=1 Tax=Tetranychus urticae TaxID=32264 RepID=T1KTZ6_TETUR
MILLSLVLTALCILQTHSTSQSRQFVSPRAKFNNQVNFIKRIIGGAPPGLPETVYFYEDSSKPDLFKWRQMSEIYSKKLRKDSYGVSVELEDAGAAEAGLFIEKGKRGNEILSIKLFEHGGRWWSWWACGG